jgi:hypothetical protein
MLSGVPHVHSQHMLAVLAATTATIVFITIIVTIMQSHLQCPSSPTRLNFQLSSSPPSPTHIHSQSKVISLLIIKTASRL